MNITIDHVKREASGRCLGLYSQYGITVREDGRHGPCPLCGGTDRFRLDRDFSGYYCNNCGPGDFINLIMRHTGLDLHETLKSIYNSLGGIMTLDPERNEISSEDAARSIKKLWGSANELSDGDLVCQYLTSRGMEMSHKAVEVLKSSIKYAPRCYESETKAELPAMLCKIVAPDGSGVSIHRTYLSPEGIKKASVSTPRKVMPPIKSISGAAIRLMPPAKRGIIGVAEGVETALSAAKIYKIPTWSVISAGGIKSFVPPPEIKTVVIFGDNDQNFTGQKASYELAHRLFSEGIKCEVILPDLCGHDFNDELKIAIVREEFGVEKS
jgi:putative DNA primase/helicase